ncbi:MAG: hypothetical protein ILA24_01935 [Ruminococcus sp.]|nr:hypothetical protein [Ruminococcus sp.]
MTIKRISSIALTAILALSLAACGSSSSADPGNESSSESTTTTTTEATTTTKEDATSSLDSEEKAMYNMLVSYSSSLLTPSSLRLSSWAKGTINSYESSFTGFKKGDDFEFIIYTAQNKMGGNTDSYAYIPKYEHSLWKVDHDSPLENAINQISSFSTSSLINVSVHSSTSIDKINRALKEYFDSKGY